MKSIMKEGVEVTCGATSNEKRVQLHAHKINRHKLRNKKLLLNIKNLLSYKGINGAVDISLEDVSVIEKAERGSASNDFKSI